MGRWKWVGLALMLGLGIVGIWAFGEYRSGGLEAPVEAQSTLPGSLPEWTPDTVDPVTPSTAVPEAESDAPMVTGAVIVSEATDVSVYVDVHDGSDDNDGLTEASALRTIGRAVEVASDRRLSGERVRVVVGPGVYREEVVIFQDPDDSPLLVVEAADPGTAVVSGADVWTAWTWDDEAEAFAHPWPFDWVPAPDVEEIVGRREIVVVDGVRLEQVTDVGDLTDGAFLVDGDRLLMLPPSGSSFSGNQAEVAVRERTLNLDAARNVVIRGFVFAHTANPFESSAVRISNSTNILFDANRVVENSWTGLGVSTSTRVTIRGSVINENGGGGAGIFQVTDGLFEGNDTSLNNWRGARGDYVGWSIAGVKAVGVHQVAFVRHRAWWNATRGLWLDYDVRDIRITDSSWCHNLTDGLFVEAAPGPIVVSGVEACENGRYGLLLVNTYGASISDSVICGNGESEIHLNAEAGGREVVTDNESLMMTAARDLRFDRNRVAGEHFLLDISIPSPDFDELVRTLQSGDNLWFSTGDEDRTFRFPGGRGGLAAWQAATGADTGSTFESDAQTEACGAVAP